MSPVKSNRTARKLAPSNGTARSRARPRGIAGGGPRSKRKQIVQAATSVFLKHGYSGTSMSKVASAAGVIKATIYSHFRNKHLLFKGIMEELTLQQGFDRFESDTRNMTMSQFIDFVGNKISTRNKNPRFQSLIRVIIGESGRFPEVARLFYETVSAQGNRMVTTFIAGNSKIKTPDPLAAAQVLTGSMVYWMLSQEILGGKHIAPISSRRIIEALKFLFLNQKGGLRSDRY